MHPVDNDIPKDLKLGRDCAYSLSPGIGGRLGTLSKTFLKEPSFAFLARSVSSSSVIIAEIFSDTADEMN